MLNAFATMLLFFAVICYSPASMAAPVQVSVSFQFFYDGLSPYGNWVSYPGYGYAWVPHAGVGFRPYLSNGRWVYTELGWTWVSNYDWGWAPFHYGTWVYDPGYGWLWVPGYDWAPAWVVWGSYGEYYGWAPCAPGFSISVGYHPPIDYWCFAQPQYIAAGTLSSYYVARNNRISIGSNTAISDVNRISMVKNVNNYSGKQFNAGPRRQDIERMAKTPVKTIAIKERGQPGKSEIDKGAVAVYRPKINGIGKNTARPSKVTPGEQIKSERGNKSGNKVPVKGLENKNSVRSMPDRKQGDQQPKQRANDRVNNKQIEKFPPHPGHDNQATPRPDHKQQLPMRQPVQEINPSDKQMAPHRQLQERQPVQQQERQMQPRNDKQFRQPVNHQSREMNPAGPPPQGREAPQQSQPERKHGPK